MYECLRLPFDKVVIDSMCDEDDNNDSYVRFSYNGYSFYFSYQYLRPVNRYFKSVECFTREQDIYVIALKISCSSYIICWMGDCYYIEFRMGNIENTRRKNGCLTACLGATIFALSFGAYSSLNSDTMVVYAVFLIFSTLIFAVAFLSFIGTFSSDFIKIRNLMRKNLMQEEYLFLPLTSIAESSQSELVCKLPKELSQRTVTVESVYRKRRKITAQYNNTVTSTSIDESYTKCMINMICDGGKYTFEYKESLFARGIGGTDIAPFIAKGDRITLYWYEPKYETPPIDREENEYGTRIICLFNKTSNNFYQSRLSIEPNNVSRVIKMGGRDIYKSFTLF